jgi:multidrug efflux system membrane fusion protein
MREGVTAELFADLPATAAHKIPSSILSLNDEGAFGVRQMMPDNTTKFTPVMVVSQEADGMWVTGLPAEVTLVVLGQDFIRDGEKVEPVTETARAKP